MAKYAVLAVDCGARIIGGCCGTSPEHLAEMKRALDAHQPGPAPSLDEIVATVGPLANPIGPSSEPRERRSSSPPLATSRSRRGLRRDCLTWRAALLVGDPALPSMPRVGLVGAPRRVDVQRLAQAFDEALLGERPVAGLAALVVDDDPDLRPEAVDHALALHRTEGRRRLGDRAASSTRVCDRLACCPPGPPDGENDTCSSCRGIRTERVTGTTSGTEPDCHDLRSNGQGRPRLPRGARRGRPGDATVIRSRLGQHPAAAVVGGGAERTSGRRAIAGDVGIITRSPAGAGSEDRLWTVVDRVACWPT